MKKIKLIDTWVSIILIGLFAIMSLINMDGTFIIGYFVVGSWQVISMITHAFNHWFTYNKGARTQYHWITLISIIAIPVGSFIPLLFLAPVMATYYTWLCYHEVYVKMQRPISLLK